MDSWQKSPQPGWYDPAQNFNTPWDYLMGTYYNVPFPGQFIDNCDGSQAAFLFVWPEAALFQDYNSISGTNTTPSHAFNAKFNVGRSYNLTVGVLGGGGGMTNATLQLSLYYRDANSNRVTVASTSITNNILVFPTNTHFVDYQVQVPGVQAKDPWAGKNIGIQLLSSITDTNLVGGYWDLDNVRLVEGIDIPNSSFESPAVPPVSPYAGPDIDSWQKSPQPGWYDPAQNFNTPWDYLMGTYYNVPFPGQFIDNCDGSQAAFLFVWPEAALFQDYNSISGTNTTPSHAFNAKFNVGRSYNLTVGVLGGGGGMTNATLQLSLYYRDANSNRVTVASTSITNNILVFPTNTHFVDYQVQVPGVQVSDLWAGKNIGIQLLSSITGTNLAGGYWDLDNVRLTETVAPFLSGLQVTNGQFNFTLLSEPGWHFDIQASTNLTSGDGNWISIATFTNTTGADSFTDTATNHQQRYYRTRKL